MVRSRYDTAVVVLSYNGKDLHRDFFPELLREANGLYDVVLIDNASTNDTADYVRAHFPEVPIVTLTVNKGFANGYYEGLKQIDAENYILLSADFEITPGWFQPLRQVLNHYPDVAAVQPKIKYYRDKKLFEYAGAGGGFMDPQGYLFCRGRVFFDIEEDQQQYNDTIEVFWAGGGCMLVRAKAYHAVGGLDCDLYAHMEEVDLCWRLKHAGHRIAYCGASTVYHIGGSVISYGSPQKLFYNYRNSLVLLYKNLPMSQLWWLLPFRLVLDGVSGVRALLKGDFIDVKTIIQAHWSFFGTIGLWHKKRKAAQAIKTHNVGNGIYTHSILVQYFLKGKKKFTELPDNPAKAL
ncbi:MAG: glycosyltransferase family 2 protein [Chitinophagaceae bacterium]